MQVDMKRDEVVGTLFHPVVAVLDRAKRGRLAVDLQGGEIADLGEPAGVLARQRREDVAGDELAGLGQPLGGER